MPKIIDDAVNLMRALGSGPRLQIMCALLDGEINVTDICDRLGMSQSGVSQHLARLRSQGLVVASRHGQFVNYALPNNTTRDVVAFVDRQYGVRAAGAPAVPQAIGGGAVSKGANGTNGARGAARHSVPLLA